MRAPIGTTLLALALLLTLSSSAQALPFHPRTPSLDLGGLNHACGVAADNKGDLYAASAGESKINVYSPAHALLTSIPDANTPCGLAVTSTGVLYASERATGKVVQFKPSAYPPTVATTYTETTIDASGKAEGISVDGFDDGLYVAEGTRVSSYVNELQTVAIENSTGGTFKLSFEGQETEAIPYNATASEVRAALEALSTIGAGNVEVTKPSLFYVFFVGALAHTDVASLGGNESGLTGPLPTRVRTSERSRGRSAQIGAGLLSEASGLAAFTQPYGPDKEMRAEHYLWVADAKGLLLKDSLLLFRSQDAGLPTFSVRELNGATTPDGSFGFGAAGAYLAADPGNRDTVGSSEPFNLSTVGRCKALGEAACTAGHLFLYDAAHKALDEFDASGSYLDQTRNAAFADAEPTQVAIERSGVEGKDGTIYLTAGAGAGARALAFAPLKAPSRAILGEPLSHKEVAKAQSVAVDNHGDVYVARGTATNSIRIYGPNGGAPIKTIVDSHKPIKIAVDSTGVVYVVDENNGTFEAREATYYTPNEYPPKGTTTYTRHEPAIIKSSECPEEPVKTLAVNPGPGAGKDRLFVICGGSYIRLYDSVAKGSGLLKAEFGKGLGLKGFESIAVDGATGTVYVGENKNNPVPVITAVDEATETFVARFEDSGFTSGAVGGRPELGVDQSDGHLVEYDGMNKRAREYDRAGGFVSEFGVFTEGLASTGVGTGIAVDNACALHEPEPLSGAACEAYDPANGTLYIAFDDPSTTTEPYDVSAFGPLRYSSEPAKHKLTVERKGTGSGTVTGGSPEEPATINCGSTCSHEYLETAVVTLEAEAPPSSHSQFKQWEGCQNPEPTPSDCEVTLNEDLIEANAVRAIFEKEPGTPEYPLTVKKTGAGNGSLTSSPEGIDCELACEQESHPFVEGTEVVLTAEAPQGSELLGWSGCETETVSLHKGTCTVNITESKTLEVELGVEHPLLTVEAKGGGIGTVTSEPPGIDCGTTCAHKFDLEEEVTLMAAADPGSKFEGWQGCEEEIEVEPGDVLCEVTMEEPRHLAAVFSTLPGLRALAANPVLYDEATLQGEVDPAGSPTEYRFEYLSEAEYEESGETFQGASHTLVEELGPGEAFHAVTAPLFGLHEATSYRFRLLAKNSVGLAEDEGSFETLQRRAPTPCANGAYRFGFSANLPDCRAYELVTPAQTDGLRPYAATDGGSPSGAINNWLTRQAGEGAGERLTYFTDGTLPGFEGNGVLDAYRAERGAGTHPADGWQSAIFSPDYAEAAPSLLRTPNQLGVSSDQLYSVWEIVDGVETFPQTLPSGTYLRTPTGFEALGRGKLGTDLEALRDYLSPAGAHAIFTSSARLQEGAAPQGTASIYDRAAGESSAEVVSVKPDGSAFGAGEGATYDGATEDGSAVIFSATGGLYLHREGETVKIASSGTFAGISADGRYVFYALGNGESAGELFRFDTQTEAAEEIATSGIFALVSPDGSQAFFSSTEVLSEEEENDNGEEAEAGARNLYAWGGGEAHFIGQLSAADFENRGFGIAGMTLAAWTRAIEPGEGRAFAPARSTPDGSVFVFQSHARLTAYDNQGVGEIYRYDPAAQEGERLLCVSCDPSAAAPTADALLEDIRFGVSSPITANTMIANLTDDGRQVFFQSLDRLLPEDANQAEDVYEWEAQGVGEGPEECKRQAGCLALISSGQGETPSTLYAMSADGRDVFFQTQEKLLGSDLPGSPSIYDARVGGGIPEPIESAPCQGDACQGQGTEPPLMPSPATTGAGESGAPHSPPQPCRNGRHRVKGRCVKRHSKKHRSHRARHNRGGGR